MIRETFPVGPLQCNSTILGDEVTGEALVIDPGDNIPEILMRLARHNLTVKQILITHAHIDHIGGALQLKKATGAPIALNERDSDLLEQMEMQAGWLGVPTPEVAPPEISAKDGLLLGLPSLPALVLATPGHTPGSICLYLPEQRLLLAGDTLFRGSIGRTDLPGGNGPQILRSLHERLLVLPDATHVVPGHGAETTIGAERESNPFLQPGVRL